MIFLIFYTPSQNTLVGYSKAIVGQEKRNELGVSS